MGRTKGAKDLQLPKRGALIALKETSNLSNRELGDRYHCHEKTVRNTLKTASASEKENIDPLSTQALQRRPQSGRPYAITPRTQRALIRHTTKNKVQRRKPWVIVAREIGIMVSASAINSAFEHAGYGRYPPRYKPLLTPEIKLQRLNFVIKWLEKLRGKEHKIVYTDETSVRVGESRGQIWVPRTKEEAYNKECIDIRYRSYTELMFWGCYTSELRGPCYLFGKETTAERNAAKEDLRDRNADYYLQQ